MGGQEWQLLQQIQALRASGMESVLACRPDSLIALAAQKASVETLTLPFRNSTNPPTLLGLHNFLKSRQPVACVCHSGHDTNNLSIAARTLQRRPRLIRSRTYHCGRASSWTYNHFVDATVVPSEHLRRQILENQRIAPHRVKTVYPGVDFDGLDADLDRPLPADLQQWIDAGDGPLLVQVGMFRREKGHHVALEAIAKARRHLPNLRYVAAGSGPLEAEIRAQIGVLGLGSSAWVGEVRPVAPLLKQADVLLMPSLAEPLGMAQIEALGLGVPVIASDADGIPETVTHLETGMLAPPGDVRKWAESIELAVSHPETMRLMAERGRADVRSRFSVELNTSTLLGLMAHHRH